MRALRLNLITPSRLPAVLLLLAGLVAAGATGREYQQRREQQRATEQRLAAQEAARERARPKPIPAEEQQRLRNETLAAGHVLARLNRPWDELFAAVESMQDENIALLGVEPDLERHGVRITAQAKDLAALSPWLERIQAIPQLRRAHPVMHQTRHDAPAWPVYVEIVAEWRSGTEGPK